MSTVSLIDATNIGPDDNGRLMTPEEFDAIEDYDECYRYELINGVLIVSPMASTGERDPNEELGHWLRQYQEDHPGVIDKTVFEEYLRTKDSRRRADRVIWTGLGRVPNIKRDVPSIVVDSSRRAAATGTGTTSSNAMSISRWEFRNTGLSTAFNGDSPSAR